MRELRFKAWYGGKWYSPVFVGGPQVPQVFNDECELVNLCAHTEEYYVVQCDKYGEIIDIYGNWQFKFGGM